jgi:hypothetical protein
MGQPGPGNSGSSRSEFIAPSKRTGGSETSQYPQEEKSIEIPPVAASEKGRAQTTGRNSRGVVGLRYGTSTDRRRSLERTAKEGDSPVFEIRRGPRSIPSTAGHVQSRGNPGGPPSKAKYVLATDSELVP